MLANNTLIHLKSDVWIQCTTLPIIIIEAQTCNPVVLWHLVCSLHFVACCCLRPVRHALLLRHMRDSVIFFLLTVSTCLSEISAFCVKQLCEIVIFVYIGLN